MTAKEPEFEIEKPGDHCLLCAKSLTDQEKHPSILTSEENKQIRKDYCAECWRKLRDRNYFCFWVAKRLKPTPSKSEGKRKVKTMLYNLFKSLSAQSSPDYSAHLFVLAHLLMKLKVFKWLETLKDSSETQTLRFYDTVADHEVHVHVPPITDDQLSTLKNQIFTLIQ